MRATCMADWKQVTARIRKARTSKDPSAQLTMLFEKTQDAMVAFELARYLETTGKSADAAKWYIAASERFRRPDWKKKAQEAAVRLGAEVSLTNVEMSEANANMMPALAPDAGAPLEQNAEILEEVSVSTETTQDVESQSQPESGAAKEAATTEHKRRRRGRRGGRNRRKSGSGIVHGKQTGADPASHRLKEQASSEADTEGIAPPRVVDRRSIPSVPVETYPDTGAVGPKGRFGDPGLSSRLSLLEMQFRRLLTCTPAKLDQVASAPVGPGVFVLTDDEMTSYYYVEACDTLRVALGNLGRGSRGRGVSIKPQLAEHLGIPETRVAKYLTDHCVVRWLQLDDGAQFFAHFAIAVLRPVLNE